MSGRAPSSTFRPEIEGLRAVAALLVAAYHVWIGRVSGGVDVFFVISGYLVTLSLMREAERSGRIDLGAYWARLTRRLAPGAFLVLAIVLVACIVILPKSRWLETEQEVLASALYVENWLLALNAVDYLARENSPSPVQHFWALSIQGQFYLLWPLLLAALFAVSGAATWNAKRLIIVLAVAACAVSFVYSIVVTAQDQPWAYFDTGARFWEFGIGAIFALVVVRPSLPKLPAAIAGWAALAAILACGMIFQAADSFPGLGALWPTLAALTILAVGQAGGSYGVGALLASRPMVALGGVAYHLYLWHWPLLIFVVASRGGRDPTDFQGVLIIAAAIGLSFLSARWVEAPVRERRILSNRGFLAALAVLIVAFVPLYMWTEGHIRQEQVLVAADAANYPGAASLRPGFEPPPGFSTAGIIPSPAVAKKDLPQIYIDDCHSKGDSSDPSPCRYGERQTPALRIALVGGSHAAQYFPALEELSLQKGWEILVFTKSACRWSTEAKLGDRKQCDEWNSRVTPAVIAARPDLIVTTSNIRRQPQVPDGYLAQWAQATTAGIPVLAIRDNPSFDFVVPECVELYGPTSRKCSTPRRQAIGSIAPKETLKTPPADVTFTDFSDYFCDGKICPAVYGNVLIYRDSHHLTATYVRTLAPMLGEEIEGAIDRYRQSRRDRPQAAFQPQR